MIFWHYIHESEAVLVRLLDVSRPPSFILLARDLVDTLPADVVVSVLSVTGAAAMIILLKYYISKIGATCTTSY